MMSMFGGGAAAEGSSTVGGFQVPEYWSFPPFFTLQPVAETREKQLQMWTAVIVQWAKATNTWSLAPHQCPLWENAAIARRLSDEGQQAVIAELIRRGHAEWETQGDALHGAGGTGRLRIMWKTVTNVANELIEHARANNMVGDVFTVYELHSGDDASGTPFHQMDPWLLRRAILQLEEQGKATLFEGATSDAEGVKFLA